MKFTGEIGAPPRSSRFGAIVIVGLILLWALDVFPSFVLPIRVLLLTLPLAVMSRSIYAVHLNLLFLCLCLIRSFPHFTTFPLGYLTAFALYAYVVLLIKDLRCSVGWLRLGRFTPQVWMLILATIAISCIALILWVQFLSPDLSRYQWLIPKASLPVTLLCGIGACILNAAVEEIIWRGVIMEALDSAFGPGLLAVLVQALSFALAHYRSGFPNGVSGSSMVFVYAIMLAIIRRKSKGIVACWLAHSAADSTIFCLILHFIHESAK